MLPYAPFAKRPGRAPPTSGRGTMLQAIHDRSKGVFAMIIIGLIGVVFVFWGVEFVSIGGFTATRGVEVNGEDVNAEEIRRSYLDELSRYQAAFGTSDLPEEVRKGLEQQAIEDAVRAELIRQRTVEMRYVATDADVVRSLQDIPAFQVDGRFSRDAYYAALRAANLEPARFEESQRRQLAARQLDRGLATSAFVLPTEIERRVALLDERRELAWALVPAARFAAGIAPDEAAIAAHYEKTRDRYLTEERADLEYVELSIDDVAAGAEVTEDELRAFYDDHLERYSSPEQRRARHVLIAATGDDAADEARARAAYDRAAAGEDFAALARELSADTGSASQGGDLGWAEREFFVAPFAEAVWSMQRGELRGPVRTQFGWHVIRLDEIRAGEVRPFEEVRAGLEEEYRRERVERQFSDLQDQLDTEAFEAAGDLGRVAEALALPVKSLPGVTRANAGPLGDSPQVTAAVFEPATLAGEQLRTVELAPGRVVAIRVAAHEPPRQRPLEEVREAVRFDLVLELAREQARGRAAGLLERLRGGEAWAAVAAEATPGESSAPREVARGEPSIPAEVLAGAFRAPRPAGSPSFGSTELPSGDVAIWAVSAVRSGVEVPGDPAARSALAGEARELMSFLEASVYVTQMRATARVKVNPQLFN